ncbi:psbB mRNA maturation factor Mbb1 [Galdieria sulphuraria]|uniref:PsbB mRNA maturation factor Mbb1 (Plastid) n=1 Tax=Galdieria sulphuraria TaxID=130081 RepID=M2XVM1_GALSU|nr:psbB mRNA maturation factor Mbb1 [Galdieria sulphuraria]EME27454.1 psbB mRNA maturation factor Mbb1 [Galdieria sulphuraria]|eukprot:XP_005703974.1 psbB mRNA maturation factor Mbb1 [Galdieria sulphuraria]
MAKRSQSCQGPSDHKEGRVMALLGYCQNLFIKELHNNCRNSQVDICSISRRQYLGNSTISYKKPLFYRKMVLHYSTVKCTLSSMDTSGAKEISTTISENGAVYPPSPAKGEGRGDAALENDETNSSNKSNTVSSGNQENGHLTVSQVTKDSLEKKKDDEEAPLQKFLASSPALNFVLRLTAQEQQIYRDMQLVTDAESIRQRGKEFVAKGQTHLAIYLFRLAIVKEPSFGKAWQDLSKVVLRKFGIFKAKEILLEAVKVNPNNQFLWKSLGLFEQRTGNIEGARNAFRTGIEKDPLHLPLYSAWARMEFYLNNYEESRKIFQSGVEKDPSNSRFYLTWAQIELRAKNYPEAARLVSLVEPLEPTNVYLWQTYAQIENAQGHLEQAYNYYLKALDLDPNNVVVLECLAKLEAKKGNVEESRSIFRKAIQLDEKDARIYACWASVELDWNNTDKAVELLQQALKINNLDSYLWLQYAVIEHRRGNVPRARALFKRGADINPFDWFLWEEWSHMEAKEGNQKEAEHLSKKSVKARLRSIGNNLSRYERESTYGNSFQASYVS